MQTTRCSAGVRASFALVAITMHRSKLLVINTYCSVCLLCALGLALRTKVYSLEVQDIAEPVSHCSSTREGEVDVRVC